MIQPHSAHIGKRAVTSRVDIQALQQFLAFRVVLGSEYRFVMKSLLLACVLVEGEAVAVEGEFSFDTRNVSDRHFGRDHRTLVGDLSAGLIGQSASANHSSGGVVGQERRNPSYLPT
jgi:hypothetical protein